MRIIGLATLILLFAYIIKIDLLDGTISLAAFSQPESTCEKIQANAYEVFPVQTLEGDTILSLFGVYPSEQWVSLTERLEAFYIENPHLRNQALQAGEIVKIPIFKVTKLTCS